MTEFPYRLSPKMPDSRLVRAINGNFDHTRGLYIPKSVVAAKGDLIAGTGSASVDNLTAGSNGYMLSADSSEPSGLLWESVQGTDVHDHNRAAWSGTATRTTSFTCPSNAKMLFLELQLAHANATGVWDMHVYVGTTSGGSELLSVGGTAGWLGYGSGTGCMYPVNGTYAVPVTYAQRGDTLYVTSYAPAGNYYLSGGIKVKAL